jgi:hypothetical protein
MRRRGFRLQCGEIGWPGWTNVVNAVEMKAVLVPPTPLHFVSVGSIVSSSDLTWFAAQATQQYSSSSILRLSDKVDMADIIISSTLSALAARDQPR